MKIKKKLLLDIIRTYSKKGTKEDLLKQLEDIVVWDNLKKGKGIPPLYKDV